MQESRLKHEHVFLGHSKKIHSKYFNIFLLISFDRCDPSHVSCSNRENPLVKFIAISIGLIKLFFKHPDFKNFTNS